MGDDFSIEGDKDSPVVRGIVLATAHASNLHDFFWKGDDRSPSHSPVVRGSVLATAHASNLHDFFFEGS